ncbi:MAG TPA: helix-turn-helix domain-containing protein [Acidimicrobiales bacterium]
MPRIRVEFTVEPFTEGVLGPHVEAALAALRRAGFTPDVGPFGNSVEGEAAEVLGAAAAAAVQAFSAGATGWSQAAALARANGGSAQEFLGAMQSVAVAIGATVVAPEQVAPEDVPLTWQGALVGGLRRNGGTDLRDALGNLVLQVETELGGRLADLPRTDKQRAVRLLAERGAFTFRNAVDEVADAMGVSRVTVYNYLNATKSP